jgi:hypothetical protein
MDKLRTLALVLVCMGLPIVSALLVADCGGGGGGGYAPPQNLQSAQAPSQPINVMSKTLMATDSSGNSWTAAFSSVPGGMATFNGQSANTSVVALTVSKSGVLVVTSDSTEYYLSNPYAPLGISGTANGVPFTFLYTSFTPLPSTLSVGGSGPFSSGNYYTYHGGPVIGSLTQTYTVTEDSPTALFLNIDSAGSLNGVQESETDTYSVTASGAATLVKAQLTVNGTTLTFQ